jgi:hypothetical protein
MRQIHEDTLQQSERLLDEYLSTPHPDYQALESQFIFLRMLPNDLRIVRFQRHAELVKKIFATQDSDLMSRLEADKFMDAFSQRRTFLLEAITRFRAGDVSDEFVLSVLKKIGPEAILEVPAKTFVNIYSATVEEAQLLRELRPLMAERIHRWYTDAYEGSTQRKQSGAARNLRAIGA